MSDRIAEPWGARTPYARGEAWPLRSTRSSRTAGRGRGALGAAASILHSNGDALDIAVKDGRIVGVRGRAVDRVNRGRLGPEGSVRLAGEQPPDRLTRPLVREGGGLVDRTGTGDGPDRRALAALLDGPGGWGRSASTPRGQLFLEEYYTLGVIGKAGHRHAAHGRQHPAVHGDRGGGAEGDLRHRRAARLVHRRRPLRRHRALGHNVAETQTVLWTRMLDRLRGPDPPRLIVVDPRPTPVAGEADVHLACGPAPTSP